MGRNHYVGYQLDFFSERVLDDLILGELSHDEGNQSAEPDGISLRSWPVESGLEFSWSGVDDNSGGFPRKIGEISQSFCKEKGSQTSNRIGPVCPVNEPLAHQSIDDAFTVCGIGLVNEFEKCLSWSWSSAARRRTSRLPFIQGAFSDDDIVASAP